NVTSCSESYTLSLHDALPIFKERESARFAVAFFDLLRSPETHEGLAASLRGRKTALKILFDSEFQMSGHFRVEFTILPGAAEQRDRKSTRLNSSHGSISYAVF